MTGQNELCSPSHEGEHFCEHTAEPLTKRRFFAILSRWLFRPPWTFQQEEESSMFFIDQGALNNGGKEMILFYGVLAFFIVGGALVGAFSPPSTVPVQKKDTKS
jgi:hypothetical protein